ncbi:hypothetical protein BRC73_04735 [Halobacteriales archaeon QH_7_66_37]|nr:MAG: hypothetical protein BRC73_04735 [Halobacteriales archaeon QH_7_66_37]
MTHSSLEQYDREAESRRAERLLRVSEHLESVLGSVDIENEEELAGEVITALKAADRAYQGETGRYTEIEDMSGAVVEEPRGTVGELDADVDWQQPIAQQSEWTPADDPLDF